MLRTGGLRYVARASSTFWVPARASRAPFSPTNGTTAATPACSRHDRAQDRSRRRRSISAAADVLRVESGGPSQRGGALRRRSLGLQGARLRFAEDRNQIGRSTVRHQGRGGTDAFAFVCDATGSPPFRRSCPERGQPPSTETAPSGLCRSRTPSDGFSCSCLEMVEHAIIGTWHD